MWTDITRREHSRAGLRYPSDLRDAEWSLIEPLFPPAKYGGRPRATDLREILNAILYLATSGCQWRMLPKDFPPLSTVQRYFYAWRNNGLLSTINHLLVMTAREQAGRDASPNAGVIDIQSVKTTKSGGICGYDAGKKVKGRKRHIVTDTCGFLIFILIHAADIQDRDGAVDVLKAIRNRFPWLQHVFADGGYAGDKLRDALQGHGDWTLEIIKRSDKAKGFELLPRSWVVERTFAWLGQCRRLAKRVRSGHGDKMVGQREVLLAPCAGRNDGAERRAMHGSAVRSGLAQIALADARSTGDFWLETEVFVGLSSMVW